MIKEWPLSLWMEPMILYLDSEVIRDEMDWEHLWNTVRRVTMECQSLTALLLRVCFFKRALVNIFSVLQQICKIFWRWDFCYIYNGSPKTFPLTLIMECSIIFVRIQNQPTCWWSCYKTQCGPWWHLIFQVDTHKRCFNKNHLIPENILV